MNGGGLRWNQCPWVPPLSLGGDGGKLITGNLTLYDIETTKNEWGWDRVESVLLFPAAQHGSGGRKDMT